MCKILADYVKSIKEKIIDIKNYLPHTLISGVSPDSRKINKNYIFIAIKGLTYDGHRFIDEGIKNGASAIIHEKPLENYKRSITYIQVKDSQYVYREICALFFDYPFKRIKLIGVTGTNGKTTTVWLIRYLLELFHKKCGLISTIKYEYPGYSADASHTTPDTHTLYDILSRMINTGCDYAAMEASSHALSQNRIAHIKFDAAIFTNLTGDHLDYHQTIENYFASKKVLFTNHLKRCESLEAPMIVNIDDKYGENLISGIQYPVKVAFGTKPNPNLPFPCKYFLIKNINLSLTSSEFSIVSGHEYGKTEEISIFSNLIGLHNVYNITGAYIAVREIEKSKEFPSLLKINLNIPGRLEHFYVDKQKKRIYTPDKLYFHSKKDETLTHVFIDYAHTHDALYNVLSILKSLAPARIITVFGCGGNRDKTKRPKMGKISYEFSDIVIITSDNPRDEEPLQIIKDIKAGIPPSSGKTVIEEPNREIAIKQALDIAIPGDIILIAGKGHETYQIFKNKTIYFDDRVVVKNFFFH